MLNLESLCLTSGERQRSNSITGTRKRRAPVISQYLPVISQHLPTAHSYADDTGIYLAFNPNDDSDQEASIAAMEACLCDIRSSLQ